MKRSLLVFLIAVMAISACASPATTAAPTAAPTQTARIEVVTVESTVEVERVVTATPVPTNTPTATATPAAPEFSYDLFDRSLDYCFRVVSEPVRGYNRVLEFLYGLRIEGKTLVEYSPEERGVDEGTWPSRVILLNAASDRQTLCNEVEARHPILYRVAAETDLQVQWKIAMDNVGNPDYAAAYKAASVKSGNLGLFIGSEKGADVAVRIYDEDGNLVSENFYRVEGDYCSDCYPGTFLDGNQGHYAPAPEDFAFEDSERDILTTDLVALVLPRDFAGYYEITTSVEAGHTAEWWLGELNPLSVPATPTMAPTATKTPAP